MTFQVNEKLKLLHEVFEVYISFTIKGPRDAKGRTGDFIPVSCHC